MLFATAALLVAAQPALVKAQTNQSTTATHKAEKKAKKKAGKNKKQKKQKANKNKQNKNQQANQNNKKKKQKAKNTKQNNKQKANKNKNNQNRNAKNKKKNENLKNNKKVNKEQRKKENAAKLRQQHKRPSVDAMRAERKRRAKHARKMKGHNVWYSDRKVVRFRGRNQYVRSRRVVVINSGYRNRFRNGMSIYYLPPAGAAIVASAYVISAALAQPTAIYDALYAPPVVHVNRRYTIDQVVEDPQVRQMVRSVDMDINFASGSSEIPDGELRDVNAVAHAMKRVLKQHPHATFLVEGHTDATGDSEDNLLLSEDRAAAVVAVLEGEYGIPRDNLEAVGYGEQYLKEDTKGPSAANRRVVVRNVSGLLTAN